jgi:hypothetical protein
MRRDLHFWMVMLMRGFIALLAGSFVLIIPDMARTLLLLPIAVVISILGLATYGVIDSTLVLISSFMTQSSRARAVLLTQGTTGIVIGVLLLSVVFEQVKLEWFLSLAALQALSTGVGELVVAKHAVTRGVSIWNYTAGVVAIASSLLYATVRIGFSYALQQREISWLVYAYLLAFGIAECLTAARMIYADREVFQEPAPALVAEIAK